MQTTRRMTLYHGTKISRAQEIDRCQLISVSAESCYAFDKSLSATKGFVYLTSNPGLAAYYGNMYAVYGGEDAFCIYEMSIDYNELCIDDDELVMRHGVGPGHCFSLEQAMDITQTCRIDRDLVIGGDVLQHLILPSNISRNRIPVVRELIRYRRSGQLDDAIALSRMLPWQIC
ncbi:hypothetical protein VQ422_004785 [Salmonella enterica]|nr:hypothetical protein [Salmonella enterica]